MYINKKNILSILHSAVCAFLVWLSLLCITYAEPASGVTQVLNNVIAPFKKIIAPLFSLNRIPNIIIFLIFLSFLFVVVRVIFSFSRGPDGEKEYQGSAGVKIILWAIGGMFVLFSVWGIIRLVGEVFFAGQENKDFRIEYIKK
ncbi:MAG: hypothetical protein QM526_02540 [Alphaproteobacteria bacterium]|nr:hypothetical protein [Alphaproteobacteria bacterium]